MGKIKNGSTYLSTHLIANDYYCETEEVHGIWLGGASRLLGIEGHAIQKEDLYFERLRKNQHPTSESKLTPMNVEDRVCFYDFQCSVPKSVSIMAVMMEDNRLRTAHTDSLSIAFKELEKFAARQIYIGDEHRNAFTGNICAAAFTHDSSRALDPQLHTHLVVANATYDSNDKKWYALETQHMCKAIRYAGQVYTNELAIRVQKLGYNIYYEKNEKGLIKTFQIDGIQKEILQLYSKRRKEIEKEITKFIQTYGREPRSNEISLIAKTTRSAKLTEISTEAVRNYQLDQLEAKTLKSLQTLRQNAVAIASSRSIQFEQPSVALDHAKEHLYERESVQHGHAILAEAINHHLGKIDLETLKQEIKTDSQLHKLHEGTAIDGLYDCLSTKENIRIEQSIIAMTNSGKNQHLPVIAANELKLNGINLEKDQAEAFEAILKNTDQIQSLRGPAGAGKSYLLKVIQEVMQNKGIALLFQATTHSAASNLILDGFKHCVTLSKFLLNPELLYDPSLLQNSFWVLDESGLASAKQMHAYLQAAKKYNARILLVGDTKQHSGVEAGDALALLEKHSHMVKHSLKEIRRQRCNPDYLKATQLMSEGKILEGLEHLDDLGWISDGINYLDQAAQRYLKNIKNNIPTLLVSPTWEEIDYLNEIIRNLKKANGECQNEIAVDAFKSHPWTRAQLQSCKNYETGMSICVIKDIQTPEIRIKKGAVLEIKAIEQSKLTVKAQNSNESFFVSPRALGTHWQAGRMRKLPLAKGDVVLLQRNDNAIGLKNNMQLTVKTVTSQGNVIAENESKQEVVIPHNYRNLTYGYAITSHKSQGLTSDEVIIAAKEMSALGKYVSATRGKRRAHLYTQNKASFIGNRINNRSKNRPMALDYIYRVIQAAKGILVRRHFSHEGQQL